MLIGYLQQLIHARQKRKLGETFGTSMSVISFVAKIGSDEDYINLVNTV